MFTNKIEFGCVTRIRYGDWKLTESDEQHESGWRRLTNYGAIHCFMMVTTGYDKSFLQKTQARISYLLNLGAAPGVDGLVDLWSVQVGSRPGCDYTLLARKAAPGIISSFNVLQQACPANRLRRGPSLDIARTDYCAINSQADLIALAREMATLPPLGRLEVIRPEPDDK